MQKQATSNEETLRSAPFGKLACKLCIPAILIMMVTVLYHMADVFFIGRTGDPNQVAAVSLVSPMFSILSGLGVLLGSGGCTAVSLALGRGEYDKVKHISAFCMYTSLGIGFVFAAVVLPGLPVICAWLGADTDTMTFTQDYLRIIAMGAPIIMFTNVVPSLIRADGSTMDSMIGNLIGTVGNIVLDPIFILLLHWNVTGAALATVLGNAAAIVYYVRFITTKGRIYAASPRMFSLSKAVIAPVITLGLPLSLSTILQSLASAIANNMMMEYGAVAVSAQSVASRIGQMITMVVMGICMGMQPVISYNFSSGNKRRLWEIIWKTTAVAEITGTVLAAVCLLLRDQVLTAFLNDPEVLRIGRICLLASIAVGPFYGFYQMCTTYLQSTGKAKNAIWVSLMEKGLIYVPMLLIAHTLFQMNGIIFAGTATTILSMAAALTFCKMTIRKELAQVRA